MYLYLCKTGSAFHRIGCYIFARNTRTILEWKGMYYVIKKIRQVLDKTLRGDMTMASSHVSAYKSPTGIADSLVHHRLGIPNDTSFISWSCC